MKEHPILFSTDMVRALLNGRKTMTRRIVKARNESGLFQVGKTKDTGEVVSIWAINEDEEWQHDMSCPYGKVGDVLWVREKWFAVEREKQGIGNQFLIFETEWDESGIIESAPLRPLRKKYAFGGHPSIHMPKEFCRIWLEITGIKVERGQDISEEDCYSEGVTNKKFPFKEWERLWTKINGAESWQQNQWVWAISFKKIDHSNLKS